MAARIWVSWFFRRRTLVTTPSASLTATRSPERWIKLLVGAHLETRDGYSLLAYPMNVEGYKRLSLLLSQGNREAAKGECDLTFKDLAEFAEELLAIVLPPRKIEDPTFRDRPHRLAGLNPGRCYLAGTMLFRGSDARQLDALDALRVRWACAWSRPTMCTTISPSAGRCTMSSPPSASNAPLKIWASIGSRRASGT